jgi:LacI family transcriptional regulator
VRIPPLGLIARQSTDVVAVPDVKLAAAVRYMREHACEGIGVGEVLRAVPMSRTAFERKFREHFGHAPYAAILKTRLQRARSLLSTTRFSVAEVAAQAGFSSGEQLAVAFRKQAWPSPRTFREP